MRGPGREKGGKRDPSPTTSHLQPSSHPPLLISQEGSEGGVHFQHKAGAAELATGPARSPCGTSYRDQPQRPCLRVSGRPAGNFHQGRGRQGSREGGAP